MDRLSEEEIKEIIDDIQRILDSRPVGIIDIGVREYSALQGLLDLYNKEKENNKILEELLQGRLFELYKYYKDLASEYQGNCVSKDKIKAKIEEVDIQLQKLKDGLTGRKTNFVNKNMLFAQKKVLQSLLEKE